MSGYYGGKVVREGVYLNRSTWKLESIAEEGGILPGNKQMRYSRLPAPVLMVFVPLMGLFYAIFVPVAYCLTFILVAVRLGGRKLRAAGHKDSALIGNIL